MENWHVKVLGTGYKEHATLAGKIIVGKYGAGNKEQILVNIHLHVGS
jgi:hypothetical protein